MKLMRIIALSILFWVLIFVEISIVMFGLKIQDIVLQKIIHLIALIPFTLLAVWLYYKNNKKAISGWLLGFLFVLIGNILDLIITVPFFTGFTLYNDMFLWFGFIEVIVLSGVFSYLFKKR